MPCTGLEPVTFVFQTNADIKYIAEKFFLTVECSIGFEPMNTGFADQPYRPLRQLHIISTRKALATTRCTILIY